MGWVGPSMMPVTLSIKPELALLDFSRSANRVPGASGWVNARPEGEA